MRLHHMGGFWKVVAAGVIGQHRHCLLHRGVGVQQRRQRRLALQNYVALDVPELGIDQLLSRAQASHLNKHRLQARYVGGGFLVSP